MKLEERSSKDQSWLWINYMIHYRPTKATIDLGAIRRNTNRIVKKYPGYKYYMAVVKADCYGYLGDQVVGAMIDGGANCLAASLIEEGVELRYKYKDIPILLFTPVVSEGFEVCVEHNFWITVATREQAIDAAKVSGLKVVIRANGGSDIFGGPTDREGFEEIWSILEAGECELTGIYLHNYNAEDEADTLAEYEIFENMTAGVDLSKLQLVSISNSLSLPRYEKKSYANGCRLGNILYNIESEDQELEHTFKLSTKVLNVFSMKKGQNIAYGHAYVAENDNECIATVPIGFGDGFSKTNIGRYVYIGDKRYRIVAITMDISHILVDESVKKGDEVLLIKDNHHLDEISQHIHGATEEAICALNKRVYREYIEA